jgi:hypothetical protein
MNPWSLLQVLVCLAVVVGVAYSQGDYDHYFGDRHHNSGPSIPNIPDGVNQNTGRYARLLGFHPWRDFTALQCVKRALEPVTL